MKRIDREYRLLAVAVVFFLAGLIFFWYDGLRFSSKPGSASSARPPQTIAVQSAQPPQGSPPSSSGQSLDPDFAKFPPPSQFTAFVYGKTGINGSSSLLASTTCNDAYVAVLVFPAAVDYRADINAAVYNEAFPCRAGQLFSTAIATSDIAPSPFGSYYLIIADEGTTGTWYNPR